MNNNQSFSGRFKELGVLFIPLAFITFSNCIFLLVEKLLLARLSTEAMEAAVNVGYACQIFQAPCIAIALMAQIVVARWKGAQDWTLIGPGIWQFIWFSFLSMLITVPASLLYGKYYFEGIAIQEIAMPYFYLLISINFLYPLATSLSCFYLGQGRTRLVLFTTVGSQLLKLILGYLLIFGWEEWIPAWGLLGGALSTIIAQSMLCLLLFGAFLSAKYAPIYNSYAWHLQPALFWSCIHPGLLRASARILLTTSLAATIHLVSAKGGDYLLILSIGSTLFLFLPFLGEAACQAQIIMVSHLLGARNYHLLDKAFRSATLLVLIPIFTLSIPLLLFPSQTFNYLFPHLSLSAGSLDKASLGIWTAFVFITFGFVPLSYLLAFKDMKFLLFMGGFGWINNFLLMYVAIQYFQMPADLFWIVHSITHFNVALLYYWRTRSLQSRMIAQESLNF